MGGKIDAYFDCVQATGNRSPFTVPAKVAYSPYESKRAAKYFGIQGGSFPSFFPFLSLLPQRVLNHIKTSYPSEVFEEVAESFWIATFKHHIDISKPENIVIMLANKFVNEGEVQGIMEAAQTKEVKAQLSEMTERALKLGAFGAPFFSVTKFEEGGAEKVEPFFGSDRFHYMFDFLGVPVTHLKILEKGEAIDSGKEKENQEDVKARL
ncbi:MAG: hypothetical protein LQ340_004308 [Diploschistes diacapsis]|nr:MAG: hypothetical protein LQ340_004308 [Diploschistes diacapsis]